MCLALIYTGDLYGHTICLACQQDSQASEVKVDQVIAENGARENIRVLRIVRLIPAEREGHHCTARETPNNSEIPGPQGTAHSGFQHATHQAVPLNTAGSERPGGGGCASCSSLYPVLYSPTG